MPSPSWPCVPPTTATTVPQNAAPDPTDRSKLPEISRTVPGAAMIPVTAIAVRMFSQLSQLRKTGDLIVKKTLIAINSATSAPNSGTRLESETRAAPATAAVPALGAGAGVAIYPPAWAINACIEISCRASRATILCRAITAARSAICTTSS